MESVGTTIQKARLQAGLSLNQVSADTCIPVKVLGAIEEDELGSISSAFFYSSFVRQFGKTVGLSDATLEPLVAAVVTKIPAPLIPGQQESLLRRISVKPLRRKRNLRWLYPVLSLTFVLVACSGFYAYWEKIKLSALLSQTHSRVVAALPSADQPGHASPQPAAQSTLVATTASFHVELSAVERTWLSIQADGKQVFAGTLEVDQTKVLEGRKEGQLRTGNAGGISMVFNGKPLGLAGPHGSVRTVVFTRDNYQVLQPSPVHALLTSLPLTEQWLTARVPR